MHVKFAQHQKLALGWCMAARLGGVGVGAVPAADGVHGNHVERCTPWLHMWLGDAGGCEVRVCPFSWPPTLSRNLSEQSLHKPLQGLIIR